MPGRSIAIAGCGIAGLAAAALLARAGERVTVFDRVETPQPIGSGLILQPVGLAVLDAIGMGARIRALGAPIRRLYGRTEPSNRIVLDVRYRALGGGAGEGLGVHRGALFEVLHDAAREAGAEMAGGREISRAADARLIFADGSQSAKFDLVVDALGVRSPLSRQQPLPPLPFGALWCNLDWPQGEAAAIFDANALEQRYEAARKMVGILPVGSVRPGAPRQAAFFWSLKHTGLDAWRATPLEAWKDDVRKLWPQAAPFIDQIVDREQLIFAAYSHGTRSSRRSAAASPTSATAGIRPVRSWDRAPTWRFWMPWRLPGLWGVIRRFPMRWRPIAAPASGISGCTSSPHGCSPRPTSPIAPLLRGCGTG